ncbi:unnamed protein product [Mucor circinelloides]
MSHVVSIPNPIRLDEFVKTHDRAAFLIDEVSMIFFEQYFCVFFGNFGQLPPVQLLKEGLLLDHSVMEAARIYTLQTNQRVIQDQDRLLRFLHVVRKNSLDHFLARQVIAERWFDPENILLEEVTRLFTRNKSVDDYTAECLDNVDITTYLSIDVSARNHRSSNALKETYLVQELKSRPGVPVICCIALMWRMAGSMAPLRLSTVLKKMSFLYENVIPMKSVQSKELHTMSKILHMLAPSFLFAWQHIFLCLKLGVTVV